MANNPAPPVTTALIEWLERIFRDRVPDMDWTDRQVWAAVESGHALGRRTEIQPQLIPPT